jgi:hypothetical protein
VRTDPAERDFNDPHPEQVLAQLYVPSAKAIGCRLTRFKFDYRLSEHVDILPSHVPHSIE